MVPPILYTNVGSLVSWAQIVGQIEQAGKTIAGVIAAKKGKGAKDVVKADAKNDVAAPEGITSNKPPLQ